MLERLLQSLAPLISDRVELIVVDNHSADDTPAVVARATCPLTYVRTESNIGVGARNIGLQRASAEIVVCLDDDVFGVDEAALATIQSVFAADATIAAINFQVREPHTEAICNWVHHRDQAVWSARTFDTYEITEGAVAFRRAALAEAGWYADYFFLSHEGPDLAFRLMDRGYRVIYRGDLVVWHWHATSGRRPWMSYYYDTRNQYWLVARSLPIWYGSLYLVRGQLSTCVYAMRDGYLVYWLRAVRDGIAGLRIVLKDRKTVSLDTMSTIKGIDAHRPSWLQMAKERLFRRDMRL
jgi:GT2 family glycosyltransferase